MYKRQDMKKRPGKLENMKNEMNKYELSILGLSEVRSRGKVNAITMGDFTWTELLEKDTKKKDCGILRIREKEEQRMNVYQFL